MKKAVLFNEEGINSAQMESSPFFAGDKIGYVFTGPKGKIWDTQTGDAYFDLGFATVHTENTLTEKGMYDKGINSPYHEGPAWYDVIANRLYFTRTYQEKRWTKGAESDTFYLRIMTADLNQARPVAEPLKMGVNKYSVCHPALTRQGKAMIFSSNAPQGAGKMDLYTSYSDGAEWTGMRSLGPEINTPYNEVFPTLLADTLLFFASDRPGGRGGFDLYVSRLSNGEWVAPELLPAPFNSTFDDLSMIVRPSGKSGYFASNRPGGLGKDDVYRWETKESIIMGAADTPSPVSIFVLDKLSLEAVNQADVSITTLPGDLNQFTLSGYNLDLLQGNANGEVILRLETQALKRLPVFKTNEDGKGQVEINKTNQYLIQVKADGYFQSSILYDAQLFGDTVNVLMDPFGIVDTTETSDIDTFFAEEIEDDEPKGDALMVLDNIYYEYNSSSIQAGAASELDTLARWMMTHPEKRVRLVAHTDSRGSTEYNLQLSIDRATAARTYLRDSGIDEGRMEIQGMGEAVIRNHCKNGIACTEKQHRFNRRTEVILLE